MPKPVIEAALGAFLLPAEIELLAARCVRSVDAMYDRLRSSPSLKPDGGVRRELLMQLLEPFLSEGYKKLLAEGLAEPSVCGIAGEAPPSEALCAPPRSRRIQGARELRLVSDDAFAEWSVEDQYGKPNCVAYAVGACLELMSSRPGRDGFTRINKDLFYQDILTTMMNGEERPRGWDSGATKLVNARDVVVNATQFSPKRIPYAAKAALYAEWKDRSSVSDGVARSIYAELHEGRPVALAMPQFQDVDSLDSDPNDWRLPSIIEIGQVPDPWPGRGIKEGAGHAVCILGFQPDHDEDLGGYFWFRNSWGSWPWGAKAPTNDLEPPYTIRPGYGTISASHVEQYFWELLSFHPPEM